MVEGGRGVNIQKGLGDGDGGVVRPEPRESKIFRPPPPGRKMLVVARIYEFICKHIINVRDNINESLEKSASFLCMFTLPEMFSVLNKKKK